MCFNGSIKSLFTSMTCELEVNAFFFSRMLEWITTGLTKYITFIFKERYVSSINIGTAFLLWIIVLNSTETCSL